MIYLFKPDPDDLPTLSMVTKRPFSYRWINILSLALDGLLIEHVNSVFLEKPVLVTLHFALQHISVSGPGGRS